MLSVSMPNSDDLLGVGRDARRSAWRPRPRRRRGRPATSRAPMRALVIVSSVVNVFEETMKSVSAGSRSRVASTKSVPSTLETKRKRQVAVGVVAQRLVGHHRAEVGAADADVDDVADRLAGVAAPLARSGPARRTRAIRSSTSWTSLTTSTPSTISERSRGIRSATCSTARSSVTLMCSPREHRVARARAARPRRRARSSSAHRLVGDPVLRVVEVEAAGLERRGARRASGSSAKRSRRWTLARPRRGGARARARPGARASSRGGSPPLICAPPPAARTRPGSPPGACPSSRGRAACRRRR